MNERLLTVAEASRRVPFLTEPQVRGLISRKEIDAIKVVLSLNGVSFSLHWI